MDRDTGDGLRVRLPPPEMDRDRGDGLRVRLPPPEMGGEMKTDRLYMVLPLPEIGSFYNMNLRCVCM